MDLSELTAENTQPLIGTKFRLECGEGQSVELTLDRVEVLLEKHHIKGMKRDSFGMFFIGPLNAYLSQGIYPTFHETLGGPMPIFYVPVRRLDDGTFEFEAVFT